MLFAFALIRFASDILVTRWAREFFGLEFREQNGEEVVTFSAETNPISLERMWGCRVSRTGGVVDISCLEVIRELSNYIDKDVTPKLREQILAHLHGCSRCTAVYNGLKNTITLTGDGRAFDLPTGFSQRLRDRLAEQ